LKKRLKWISVGLTVLLGLFVVLFIIKSERKNAEPTPVVIVQDTIVPANLMFDINVDSFEVIQSTIKKNEFLANILLPYNIDYGTIDALAKKSKSIFDVRRIAVGKNYTLLISKDSLRKASYFIYEIDAVDYVVYDLTDSIVIERKKRPIETKTQIASGVINSSLYQTLQESNVNPYLAVQLADIFAWSIDFYRIQKGDWFKVIYEEKFVEGTSIGVGKIEAVEFNHFDRSYLAFGYDVDGRTEYYDEEANSLRKAFLKSPLKFSRLSSRFTMRRFHPVQKRWKAHLGTDYAAPRGTPIMATSDGVVIKSAYGRGNGNYVKLRHNSVYETQYLHMSKRNVKVGTQVRQGDVIGYVGSTGLATGPHVCYRFWKNGKQVDHLREDFPSAEPISPSIKANFMIKRDSLQADLNVLVIGGINS
tara:strand:+ start:456 stop:1712 length:1257 start_codon:yes stop_codon:yes gene_type:complete